MRHKSGTKVSSSEKVIRNIRRKTRRQYCVRPVSPSNAIALCLIPTNQQLRRLPNNSTIIGTDWIMLMEEFE
jgi:hypothetical protein